MTCTRGGVGGERFPHRPPRYLVFPKGPPGRGRGGVFARWMAAEGAQVTRGDVEMRASTHHRAPASGPGGSPGDERGQELVEFALIASLLFLLIIAVIEFGFLIHSYNAIANVAREGARAGVVPAATVDGILNAARARAAGLNPGALSIGVSLDRDTVRVDVGYDHALLTGAMVQFFGGQPAVHLQTSSTMNRE